LSFKKAFKPMPEYKLLTKDWDKINPESIESYLKVGGYQALKKALSKDPGWIIQQVKNSLLRGRSGAFFPTGLKWEIAFRALKKKKTKLVERGYLIANAHEGEPQTFKDKYLLENNPHLVIEGLIIAGYALGIHTALIYLNESYHEAYRLLSQALEGARKKGFLGSRILKKNFNLEIKIVLSLKNNGYYLMGEESTLLEVLEGRRPEPRLKPPYISEKGLYGKPTVVNNVETLANIPLIVKKGGLWFRKIGAKNLPGTKLITLAQDIEKPGVYEIKTGTFLREVIFQIGQGVKRNQGLGFVQVGGGVSGRFFTEAFLETPLDETSGLGIGTILVFDQTKSVYHHLKNLAQYFAQESCGKCGPCREGTSQIRDLIYSFESKPSLLIEKKQLLGLLAENLSQASFCGLGKMAGQTIGEILHLFPQKLEKELRLE